MINPKRTSIEELFNLGAKLQVPRYQRKYAWGKSEVLDMMADLKSAMADEKPIFFGNFVFDISDSSKFMIVDGQQRITTLKLLLIACRERAKRLGNTQQESAIQNKVAFQDPATGSMSSERVLTSPSVSDVFAYISDVNWDELFPDKIQGKAVKVQSNKLKPLYEFMKKELSSFDTENLSKFLRTIYSAYVIQIDIMSELEAFDIFERMNARGQSLTAADLIKNYLYANLPDSHDIESQWEEITKNAGTSLQRMLKYFWVSRKGTVRGNELYSKLKQYGQTEGAVRLTQDLADFSAFFATIRSNDPHIVVSWLETFGYRQVSENGEYRKQLIAGLQGLNLFNITQHIPLVYSMFLAFGTTDRSDSFIKVLLRLVRNLEKYHFINNQICGRIGNEVEKPYAEFAEKFAGTTDFRDCARKFNQLLKEKLATEEEFVTNFTELCYEPTGLPSMCYIFDRINNHGMKATQWQILYNPDPGILKGDWNQEHFLSQTPAFEVPEKDMEAVHNIGNLFVISRHSNSTLQNMPPEKKIQLLREKSANLRYIMKFVESFENGDHAWGRKEIQERSRNLALRAYREVWKQEQI